MVANGIGRTFFSGSQEIRALDGVDVNIEKGKLTILRGRSGSGKTTLLNILSGLDDPTAGKVYFGEQELTALNKSQKDNIRARRMGFVFQAVALMPQMSAYENVEFMLRIAGLPTDEERVVHMLNMVGLGKRMHHFPAEMSGGEQQRVAIARAMVHRPELIFADEPTAELDSAMGFAVMKIFRDAVNAGETVVMTTHDTNIMELADVIYTLEDGRVIDITRKEQV